MKQTAVEFIETELKKLNIPTDSGTQVSVIRIIEQAKAMEKEQIMKFVMKFMMQDRPIVSFYNEQFKSEQDETGS